MPVLFTTHTVLPQCLFCIYAAPDSSPIQISCDDSSRTQTIESLLTADAYVRFGSFLRSLDLISLMHSAAPGVTRYPIFNCCSCSQHLAASSSWATISKASMSIFSVVSTRMLVNHGSIKLLLTGSELHAPTTSGMLKR